MDESAASEQPTQNVETEQADSFAVCTPTQHSWKGFGLPVYVALCWECYNIVCIFAKSAKACIQSDYVEFCRDFRGRRGL